MNVRNPARVSSNMQLLRDGVLFGTLTDYQYETPWALARITPVDAEAWARLCRATKQEDLAALDSGGWSIVNPASTPRDARGPIDLYECGDDGWIRWRWR